MIKYSNDKATQILVALLKEHGIRKVIVSPGTTNMCLVASLQYDSFFQIYSCVDERSAAYMACGMSCESGEAVVITCTEATASRNYLPALTEAYYRKLPILAITGFHNLDAIGHLQSQVIDRCHPPIDTVRVSFTVRTIRSENDEWVDVVNINKAILELTHNGGGPVHINLQFPGNVGFDTENLPIVRKIGRIMPYEKFPEIPTGRIAIFVGSHKPWKQNELAAIDAFCKSNNAVVFCDQTSGYKGKYRVNMNRVFAQKDYRTACSKADLLIHVGEVSGNTYAQGKLRAATKVWRVSEDGEVRDTFRKLEYVFQMPEEFFFSKYSSAPKRNSYFEECQKEIADNVFAEFPFSNMWVAERLSSLIPEQSVVHLGIFNSLRSWNMNEMNESVLSYCNVGGFGIDGVLSTAIGASLVDPDRLYYCMCGDLAFFYDMNSLCNRHVGKNLRILLINNGKGVEFRNYGHPAYSLGQTADPYIAAAGHNGNQSQSLVKNYAKSLGFCYLAASTKEEFEQHVHFFVDTKIEQPMFFEVFTQTENEANAQKILRNTIKGNDAIVGNAIEKIIGEKGKKIIKSIISK